MILQTFQNYRRIQMIQPIPQHYLDKDKKHYKNDIILKDKQNWATDNVNTIIEKLLGQEVDNTTYLKNKFSKFKSQTCKYQSKFLIKKTSVHKILNQYESENQIFKEVKALKNSITNILSKLKLPQKLVGTYFNQFSHLVQESTNYIEFFIKKNNLTSSHDNQQMLSIKDNQIIVCILRHNFPCLNVSHYDVYFRLKKCLKIDLDDDFGQVSWEKYLYLRKLINGTFSRKQAYTFILNYMFFEKQQISIQEFWNLFQAVFRKLRAIAQDSYYKILLSRVKKTTKQCFNLGEHQIIDREKFNTLLQNRGWFIWHQFINLIFVS